MRRRFRILWGLEKFIPRETVLAEVHTQITEAIRSRSDSSVIGLRNLQDAALNVVANAASLVSEGIVPSARVVSVRHDENDPTTILVNLEITPTMPLVYANLSIAGSVESNLLFVDATNDRIGIGTTTPTEAFRIGVDTPLTDEEHEIIDRIYDENTQR